MALNFRPKSEEQLAEESLAPAGEYDFQVIGAEDARSKAGNSMIKLKLGIYRGETMRNHVYDYLLESMEFKLRHFCEGTGLIAKYEAGTLCADDCKGRTGRCRLAIDTDDDYPPKNVVKDYTKLGGGKLRQQRADGPPSEEDDVPF